MRSDGWYWVKHVEGGWVVAKWEGNHAGRSDGMGWIVPGYCLRGCDDDFERIGSMVMPPPEEYSPV